VQVLSHPDLDPFLTAIRTNEGEDTPRLVFADWLQEQYRTDDIEFRWADLIRHQCEMARVWPYPTPPSDWAQVGDREAQRKYHAHEKAAISILRQHQLDILALGGMNKKQVARVSFRRGFPGIRTSAKEVYDVWAPRPSWKLFMSLTLSSAGGRPNEMAKILARDTLNEVAFLPDTNLIGIHHCLDHFDRELNYKYPDRGPVERSRSTTPGDGSLRNLRRLGIGVYDLNMAAARRIIDMPPVRYPEVRVVVTAYSRFSRHAVEHLQQELGGQKVVFNARAGCVNGTGLDPDDPPPGGVPSGYGGPDGLYGPPGSHAPAPGGWNAFAGVKDPIAALLGKEGAHLRPQFPEG
jgi:uncharacterized protein (TIGR02996 family)